MHRPLAFTLAALLTSTLFAQTAATEKALAFDVASVRQNKTPNGKPIPEKIETKVGAFTMRGATLASIIAWAYDVRLYQISGPRWMSLDRYDIIGRAGREATKDELRKMAQTLLAERFGLTFHRETKTLSVYALVIAKSGLKCKENPEEGEYEVNEPPRGENVGHVMRAPVSLMIDLLYQGLETPVIDQTGLKGRYDCTVDPSPYRGDGPTDRTSMIMAGLEGIFGLKLQSTKAPIEMMIIEKVNQTPTEN